MPAHPLGPQVDQLLHAAQEQSRGEQMLSAALDMAMNRPHTVHTLTIHKTGVRNEGPLKVLMVATVGGERYDIQVGSPAAIALARALMPVEEQAA